MISESDSGMNREVIMTFAQQLTKELNQAERYGTARAYGCSVRSFLKFAGNEELSFSDLNQSLLKEYEQYLKKIGRTPNTVSLYLRMLRSICHQAAERLNITLDRDLFSGLFLGTDQKERHAASLQVFERLDKLDLKDKHPSLRFARDLFMLSFYFKGIPFIDLAHLRKDHIRDGVLYYRRGKMKKERVVFLEPCAMNIINRYSQQTEDDPYLLPIFDRNGKNPYLSYQAALRWYNRSLNSLSQMLGLKRSLTSYAPRHSWMTTVYRQGFPVSALNGSMGHMSEEETYRYLNWINDQLLQSMNRPVISSADSIGKERQDVQDIR
jgi:integrase